MAKKYVDAFGGTPKVRVNISEARRKQLTLDDWFVEYKNTDTRNGLAHALQLIDHDGDSIFYDGREVPGFKVPFASVEFLVNSLHNGAFKFITYHKKPSSKIWQKWEEHKKPPKTILRVQIKAGNLG